MFSSSYDEMKIYTVILINTQYSRACADRKCRVAPSKTKRERELAASGVYRISARGVLKVRPHTKSGGGGDSPLQADIRKVGGGGGQSTSGPIDKKCVCVCVCVGGACSPLQVRYLCLAHRKYVIVNNKRLQF